MPIHLISSGDSDGTVTIGSPFYTGHCNEDSLNIASPGHASPPEICGPNSGQHMFIPMSDQCVMINLNIGTSTASRSWNIKVGDLYTFSLFLNQVLCAQVVFSLIVKNRIQI